MTHRIVIYRAGNLIAVSCHCQRSGTSGPGYAPLDARRHWEPYEPFDAYYAHLHALALPARELVRLP